MRDIFDPLSVSLARLARARVIAGTAGMSVDG
jgi:hypothetical protein